MAGDLIDNHGRLLVKNATVLTQDTIDQTIERGISHLLVRAHPAVTGAQKRQTRRRTDAAAVELVEPWQAQLRHTWLLGDDDEPN